MLKKKFITYMLDFMLDKWSPLNLYEKKNQMGIYIIINFLGNPNFPPNFSTVFEIACFLINKFEKLSEEDSILLYSSKLIDRVLKNVSNVKMTSEFIKKMCYNNMLYSELICTSLLKLYSMCNLDELQQLF